MRRYARGLVGSLTAGVLLGAAVACSSGAQASDGRIQVVASTDVWGDIVAQIGGDRVDVTSVISDPNQDPHSYEVNIRTQLQVDRARLVVENGGGYDDFMDRMVAASSGNATVLNAVQLSGYTGDDLNEHVWYDFPTVLVVAQRIEQELAALDPASADKFASAATVFEDSVRTLQQREQALATKVGGTGVAITEPVPLYLLQACGLVNRTPAAFSAAIESGTDVAATVLRQTLQLFDDRAVAALVYNEQTTSPQTALVLAAARSNAVPSVGVDETLPQGEDYQQWMNNVLDALTAAVAP